VPWHRVITASGRIAFSEGSDRYNEQAKRLKMEDVDVGSGKVNMDQYRWHPDLDELLWKPTDAWDENIK
jgi:methylated-DNA-protein-cysteine methyltransferase-like protein